MRNTSVRVLAGAGAFAVTLAGLTAAVATPALLKAPVVNSTTTEASGPATRLDAATGEQVTGTFFQYRAVGTHTEEVGGKPVAVGGGDVAVYDSYSASEFRTATETKELTKDLYTQAFDRSTGVGRPGVDGDTAGTTAHVFKLPFGVEKKTYQLWDSQTRQAFPLTFKRETQVKGLDVYEFTQTVPPTDTGELPVLKAVPGALVGEPSVPSIPADQWVENLDKVVWVEPVTGKIVGGLSNPHIWAQTADGRKVDLLKVDGATPTDKSLTELVDEATADKSKVQTLQRAPWALGALGLLLLGLAAGLARRRPADEDAAAPAVLDLTAAERRDVTSVLPIPRSEDRARTHLRP